MKSLQSAIIVACLAAARMMAADAGLLEFAGPDSTEIAGVNVERAVISPLGLFLQNRAGVDNPDFQKFIAATGFDPRKDLQEVIAISSGGSGLIAARGVFASAALTGREKETYNGVTLYEGPHGKSSIAFPEPTLALFGDEKALKAAIDRRGTSSGLDPLLGDKVRDASSRYDAWFVAKGRPGLRFGQAALPDDALQVVSGGLTLGDVVQLNAEAVMRSEKDAQSLVDLIRFLSSIAQFQRQRNPNLAPLLALLTKAETRVQGTSVVFTTFAAETEIEQLLGNRKRTAALRQ